MNFTHYTFIYSSVKSDRFKTLFYNMPESTICILSIVSGSKIFFARTVFLTAALHV